MRPTLLLRMALLSAFIVDGVSGQPYTISTAAGGAPTPTPVAALAAAIQPNSVSVDASGNVYFSNSQFSSTQGVFKVDPTGVLTRVAGNGRRGFSGDGGPALDAELNGTAGAIAGPSGDVYVIDQENNRIRRVTADGMISTIAGISQYYSYSGDGGAATAAGLFYPTSIALDNDGNLYIADSGNHRIRKVTTDGIIQTVAGNGQAGNSGDDGPATQAAIGLGVYSTQGLALDAGGSLFIAVDNLVRRISSDGIIATVAGTGVAGTGGDGGPAIQAQLTAASGVAVDRAGNLYISESGNPPRVRKVSADGIITTVAGASPAGFSGDGGPATAAQLFGAAGVAVDSSGDVFLADEGNNRIRKISPAGVISTFAGNGLPYFVGDGGPAKAAQLNMPLFVAMAGPDLLVSELSGQRVRKVSADGIITTIAGIGGPIVRGAVQEGQPAVTAHIGRMSGVVADARGNTFLADSDNACVWKVGPDGRIGRFAGNGQLGSSGDGGAAVQAELFTPWGLALDGAGNLYIADENAHRIRKVSTNGVISTVAGNGIRGFSGDGGPATGASLNTPESVVVDSQGNLYIADAGNNRVRKVALDGVITTAVGDGSLGFQATEGPATGVGVSQPYGLALDSFQNLYVSNGLFVFRVSPEGMLTVAAGNLNYINTYSGDGGAATEAELSGNGLAVGPRGEIYIADGYNGAVRLLRPYLKAPRHTPFRLR